MQLGRVTGCLWCSVKNASLESQRMLVVQPCLPDGTYSGKPLICLDAVGVGAGELIYWCRGREATFPFLPVELPADATIVGVVDGIELEKAKGA